MLTELSLHYVDKITVQRHYPENSNSIQLRLDRRRPYPGADEPEAVGLALYDLPPGVTDALVAALGFTDDKIAPTIEGNGKVSELVRAAQAVAAMFNSHDHPLGEFDALRAALARFPEFTPGPSSATLAEDALTLGEAARLAGVGVLELLPATTPDTTGPLADVARLDPTSDGNQ